MIGKQIKPPTTMPSSAVNTADPGTITAKL
jgi:hypothetical protein